MKAAMGEGRPECDCRHDCCCRRISLRPRDPRPQFFHTPKYSTAGQPIRRKEDAPIRTFTRAL